MSSLNLKPTFLLYSYGSSSSSSIGSRQLCSLISFQRKTFRKQKFTLRAQSIDSPQNNNENDTKPPNGSMVLSFLLFVLLYFIYPLIYYFEMLLVCSILWRSAGKQVENFQILWMLLQQKSRREILLDYVQNVQPEFMELFVKKAPKQVFAIKFRTLKMFVFFLGYFLLDKAEKIGPNRVEWL